MFLFAGPTGWKTILVKAPFGFMSLRAPFLKTLYYNRFAPAVLLLVFTVASRFQTFGNPLLNIDEEFYLFAGGRILHGDLPYLAFWDRKPALLFVLYAVFHLFGAYRVLAYQIGAALAVWGTSLLLYKMARTLTSRGGALIAGMLYCTGLTVCGGEGGQTPVFYTLLVAGAMALVLFKVVLAADGPQQVRRVGLVAMGLFGLSMQIKYTTVFEGVFLGLYLLWYAARKGQTRRALCADAALWVIPAVLPTAAVFLFYALIGHAHDWFFANVDSIFLRGALPAAQTTALKIRLFKAIAPLLAGGAVAVWLFRNAPGQAQRQFLTLWALAACCGVAVFGGWYYHYALPLFAPLAVVSSPLWDRKAGRYWLVLVLAVQTVTAQKRLHKHRIENGDARTYQAYLAAMPDPEGCLFVYEGPPILYDTSHWCGLTNHPFPGHFNEQAEIRSTGMNPSAELDHILAQKPRYVVTQDPAWAGENLTIRAHVFQTLTRDYRAVYRHQGPQTSVVVYQRAPLP